MLVTEEERKKRNRETKRRWRAAHPGYWKEYDRTHKGRFAKYWHGGKTKQRYGLTEADYQRMLRAQNGLCAICGRPPKKYKLAVDHDHTTKKVRALLCIPCNSRLHTFESGFRVKAEKYLESHTVEVTNNA